MSIRLRLTLWYSSLFAVSFIVIGIIIYNFIHHSTMLQMEKKLTQTAVQVKETEVKYGNEISYNLNPLGFDASMTAIQLIAYHQGKIGNVAGKSRNMYPSNLTFAYPPQDQAKERYALQDVVGIPFYVFDLPFTNSAGEVIGLLQVGLYANSEVNLLSQLRLILLISGMIGVLAAFVFGLFLSRKALRPINSVTRAAEQIQGGLELGLRIPRENTNDEIGRLTDTLNGMLSRLERAYQNLEASNQAQRRFVSDASHELRTPLTTIRGNIDLLEKMWTDDAPEMGRAFDDGVKMGDEEKKQFALESIRDIADEARRMSRLVNDLLSLARADAGYVVDLVPLQLLPLAEEAVRRASFLPRSAEWVSGPLEALEHVRVLGNRDYLLQLLFIFIENGFKYTPEGEVRLFAAVTDHEVGLTVADTGIGLGAEEIPHLFERFYRADESRGRTAGTGLGLSIAKWIADLHHARIEVRSAVGRGTAFTIWLPIWRDFTP